jgi:hypothetical protein
MIWLTWRQSRLEALIGGAALALVAVFLLWTGHHMISAYNGAGLPACVAAHAGDDACRHAAGDFLSRFERLDGLVGWLNLLPFLLGLLLAAPTLVDFEQGTYRLAWTQSVTRRRWLAGKVGFGLAIAVGVSAALVALSTWWHRPFDGIEGRFRGSAFDFEGTVTVGYVVFAFALCLAVGTLLRRTIPAAGIGLVVFLVARIGVLDQLRPRYLDPITLTWDPTGPTPAAAADIFGDGSWVLSRGMVIAGGGGTDAGDPLRACADAATSSTGDKRVLLAGGADNPFNRCLHDHGVLNAIVYHPADRFWTIQAIETALFLGAAAGLLALTAWWVMRRIA